MGGLWHNWHIENRATSRASGTVDLVDVLGPWSEGQGPLFRKLARAISSAIERGILRRGMRLPSERALAQALAIGRGTAVAAYDLVVTAGLLERRHGSGSYVVLRDPQLLPTGREGSALVHRLVEQSQVAPEVIDLSISVLHDAAGLPDISIGTGDLLSVTPASGYTPWGLMSLRQAIAAHVTDWGLPTQAHEVVVTTGAQQGIAAAAACWVSPGDTVVVDDPTYPGALSAFTQAGAVVVGTPMDREGVRLDALANNLGAQPSLLYLQSTAHSPTGTVTSARRRSEIADLVARARVPLVEDLALADLTWRDPPPPIAAALPGASVAVVGSLSKLFWGGLRIGFVRAPEPLALRFARVKATHDLGSSAVSQLLADRLLRSGPVSELAPRRVDELRARHGVMAAALRRYLPDWTWLEPEGGLSLWVRLPATSAEAFAQHAVRFGVAVATPRALSPSNDHLDHLRLSFAAPPAELEEGVHRLATAWAAHRM